MTQVYYVRHAEVDYNVHNDVKRPLTEKGKEDTKLIVEFFKNMEIHVILSSPYMRAIDTVSNLAKQKELDIITNYDLRERKIDSGWLDDFTTFCINQWKDFDYKLADGESLREVTNRNISVLNDVLSQYEGKNIVIGSHGTALSAIIHHYDSSFGYDDFNKIKYLMPWIVKFTFDDKKCIQIEKIDVFENNNNGNKRAYDIK